MEPPSRRVVPGLLALLLAGCGQGGEPPPPAPPPPPSPAAPEARAEPGGGPLYDAQGELLPSGEVVAGLALPRGLQPVLTSDREHVYRTKVSLQRLQRYFGPRLLTGKVEPLGGGVVYREAVARDARGAKVKLDVKLVPGAAGTRVEIVELPPSPPKPPPLEELERRAREKKPEL